MPQCLSRLPVVAVRGEQRQPDAGSDRRLTDFCDQPVEFVACHQMQRLHHRPAMALGMQFFQDFPWALPQGMAAAAIF